MSNMPADVVDGSVGEYDGDSVCPRREWVEKGVDDDNDNTMTPVAI